MASQLHTVAEAAGILKVRESWLKTKAAARLIPCTFVGKHLRFSDDDIAEVMKTGARQPVTTREGSTARGLLTVTPAAYAATAANHRWHRTAADGPKGRSMTAQRRHPSPPHPKGASMAYAEKRGKGPRPWRVKYKLPDGTEVSESGFETKAAALIWGGDQETRIREGRWTDPNAGQDHG